MAILGKTITQSGIELGYHRIGEYLETDTQIIFMVHSYPTQEIREEYQPAFKTEVVIEKRGNTTYKLHEMEANHYNYAYAHLLYMMQNNNFYLKVVGECVNDEPTIIAIDEMVVEYYTQDMVEEDMDMDTE
jgi:hypothetical protein